MQQKLAKIKKHKTTTPFLLKCHTLESADGSGHFLGDYRHVTFILVWDGS